MRHDGRDYSGRSDREHRTEQVFRAGLTFKLKRDGAQAALRQAQQESERGVAYALSLGNFERARKLLDRAEHFAAEADALDTAEFKVDADPLAQTDSPC
jgi:hypothetical protein